ncbi:MAG: phytase [Rhodospirillaceae bacterium]|jgi:3-phytase|nr:phytase [Rhodospirillaceae bacterium]MBT5564617.1 phytase [Rhodospirillaceae bacterium]
MTLKISHLVSVALFAATFAACSDDEGPAPVPSDTVSVTPTAETVPVKGNKDAADDPAIWVNPDDPEQSLIIGTDKKNGLVVYDLSGAIVYQNADGRMNNVDVRSGYPITTDNGNPDTATPTIIVAATNRTSKTIAVYAMNPNTGALSDIMVDPIPSNMEDPYGLCLYRSAVNGKLYVYANDKDGTVSQWQLYDNGLGQLRYTIQRIWSVGSQPEGCVADDANGVVYIGEEGKGIWRYGAEPKDSFNERTSVDKTGLGNASGGHLAADVEGLALYAPPAAAPDVGYLIASSQGNHTYVVYDRAVPHAYRGTFQIVDNSSGDVDGVQETDGLDVVSAPLGSDYPAGLLVVQDGDNKTVDGSDANQNFKYVSWADVAEALGLE